MSLQPDRSASAGISPSEYQSLSTQWAYAALGVAWLTRVVVTIPTDLPAQSQRFTERRAEDGRWVGSRAEPLDFLLCADAVHLGLISHRLL